VQAHVDQRDIARVQQVRGRHHNQHTRSYDSTHPTALEHPTSRRAAVIVTCAACGLGLTRPLLSCRLCCVLLPPAVCPVSVGRSSSLACRPHHPQTAAVDDAHWPAGDPSVHQAPLPCATSRGPAQARVHGIGAGQCTCVVCCLAWHLLLPTQPLPPATNSVSAVGNWRACGVGLAAGKGFCASAHGLSF
jgi:hypothetical protein